MTKTCRSSVFCDRIDTQSTNRFTDLLFVIDKNEHIESFDTYIHQHTMKTTTQLNKWLRTALAAATLVASFNASAAIVDFDFSMPGSSNRSLGLNPTFNAVNDFQTGLTVSATASATQSGVLEVHRNRINGLGVTGGRNDPFANRINSHSTTDNNNMESLHLHFGETVDLLSVTFRAVGAGSSFMLIADPANPLSAPVFGSPTNGVALDLSSFGIAGSSFSFAAAGFGQSLRVHSLQVATRALVTANSATAPAPATSILMLLGVIAVIARRRVA